MVNDQIDSYKLFNFPKHGKDREGAGKCRYTIGIIEKRQWVYRNPLSSLWNFTTTWKVLEWSFDGFWVQRLKTEEMGPMTCTFPLEFYVEGVTSMTSRKSVYQAISEYPRIYWFLWINTLNRPQWFRELDVKASRTSGTGSALISKYLSGLEAWALLLARSVKMSTDLGDRVFREVTGVNLLVR